MYFLKASFHQLPKILYPLSFYTKISCNFYPHKMSHVRKSLLYEFRNYIGHSEKNGTCTTVYFVFTLINFTTPYMIMRNNHLWGGRGNFVKYDFYQLFMLFCIHQNVWQVESYGMKVNIGIYKCYLVDLCKQ